MFGTAAFLINWQTRGADGTWWMVWLFEAWAVAWGLHMFGVMVARHSDHN